MKGVIDTGSTHPAKVIDGLEDSLRAGKVLLIHLPDRVARITPRTFQNWSRDEAFFVYDRTGGLMMNDGRVSARRVRYRPIEGCLVEIVDPSAVDWSAPVHKEQDGAH